MADIDNILDMDPVAMAEKLAGKYWGQFTPDEQLASLCVAMLVGDTKKKALEAIGDTNFGMTWTGFKDIIKNFGFLPALEYEFLYEEKYKEQAIVYYHTDGLLIWATSWGNQTLVNGGSCYGECMCKKEDWGKLSDALHGCSSGPVKSDDEAVYIRTFDKEVREGLIATLSKIKSVSTMIPVWIDPCRSMWFMDYVEKKDDELLDMDFEKRISVWNQITKSKIERMCPEAQAILANWKP